MCEFDLWYQQQAALRTRNWGPPAKLWPGSNPLYPGGGLSVWKEDDLLIDEAVPRWKSGISTVDREWTDAIAAARAWSKVKVQKERQQALKWNKTIKPVVAPWTLY